MLKILIIGSTLALCRQNSKGIRPILPYHFKVIKLIEKKLFGFQCEASSSSKYIVTIDTLHAWVHCYNIFNIYLNYFSKLWHEITVT